MQVYPEVDLKKKIKTKLDLSDGNNIITCMMSEKIYKSFVRKFRAIKYNFSKLVIPFKEFRCDQSVN